MRVACELICFDLDGTLVDSAPDLCLALGDALRTAGLPAPSEAQTRGWIGDGIDRLLQRALDAAGVRERPVFDTALRTFHASYSQNLYRDSRLYPHVEAVLQQLQDAPHRLCCITNKRADYAEAILNHAGIAGHFEFVFGGDTFAQKKPHARQLLEAAGRVNADPARCVMIGDSDTDGAAADAAGFAFLWAAFGYCRTLPTVRPVATARVEQFADIPVALPAVLPAA